MGRYVTLSLLTLLDPAVTLCLQFFIARRYGVHGTVDAWIAGMTLPAVVSTVAGSLGSQLVMPVLVHASETEGETGFHRELSAMFTLFLAAGLVSAFILAGGAPLWVRLTAPGLSDQVHNRAAWFLSVSAVGLVPGILTVLYSQAAQALGRFRIAPVLSVSASLSQLVAMFLAPSGDEIYWMMVTQVAVSVLLLPVLAAYGAEAGWVRFLRPTPRTSEFLRRAVPALIIVASTRVNHAVDTFFASYLPQGKLSALGYAIRGTSILQAALAAPVISIVFAELSKSAAREDWDGFAGQGLDVARKATFISAGVAAVVAGLGWRGARLLLGWGPGAADSETLAACFVALSGIIAFASWGSLLARICFSSKMDSVAVVYLGIVPVIFNAILDWLLVDRFGVAGLAAATSFNALIGLPLVDWQLRRAGKAGGDFYRPLLRALGCAIVTGAVLWHLPLLFGTSSARLALECVLLGTAGLGTYTLLATLLGETLPKELLNRDA